MDTPKIRFKRRQVFGADGAVGGFMTIERVGRDAIAIHVDQAKGTGSIRGDDKSRVDTLPVQGGNQSLSHRVVRNARKQGGVLLQPCQSDSYVEGRASNARFDFQLVRPFVGEQIPKRLTTNEKHPGLLTVTSN